MSNHANVTIFCGVCYEYESIEAAKFDDDDDKDDSPSWMTMNNVPRHGVEVVFFGHYDLSGYGIAVAGTVRHGKLWAPLEIGETPPIDAAALFTFCEKWGFPKPEPKWWAVPYYG